MHLHIPTVLKPGLRWIVHISCLVPLSILLVKATGNNLTVNPIQAASQFTGLTAFILLSIMLGLTPLAMITHEPYWRSFRKPVGLYAFLYASLHMLIFMGLDYNLNFSLIALEFSQKPYLWLGLTALIILALMAVTSFKTLKRRMGKNWKRLHQLVYPAAFVILLHDALSQKASLLTIRGNLIQPIVFFGVIVILLGLRLPPVKHLLKLQ
jgi:methionine sulfoxide reductase heme-binding subunit